MSEEQLQVKNKLPDGLSFRISPLKEQIKKTKPHKHDSYYELIFLSEGEGFHCIESEKFLVSAPECFVLKPGQLHFWQFTSVPKGFVILFNENEFDSVHEHHIIELYRNLETITNIPFSLPDYPAALLNELYAEFQKKKEYSNRIIHGIFSALLGKLLQETHTVGMTEQPLTIFDKFKKLLLSESHQLRKVNEYAALLHTTPQNLNAVCRKQTGKNAGQFITEQLVLEAKRYILHTDYTVNEIAHILSFSDASHFVKFFKRHTGNTPLQFREKHFQ